MNFQLRNLYTETLPSWEENYGLYNGKHFYDVSSGRVILRDETNAETEQIYIFHQCSSFCIPDAYNNCYDVLEYCHTCFTRLYILQVKVRNFQRKHLEDMRGILKDVDQLKATIDALTNRINTEMDLKIPLNVTTTIPQPSSPYRGPEELYLDPPLSLDMEPTKPVVTTNCRATTPFKEVFGLPRANFFEKTVENDQRVVASLLEKARDVDERLGISSIPSATLLEDLERFALASDAESF